MYRLTQSRNTKPEYDVRFKFRKVVCSLLHYNDREFLARHIVSNSFVFLLEEEEEDVLARIVYHEGSSSSWRIEGPFDRKQQESSTSKRRQQQEHQEANFFTHHQVHSSGCQIIKAQEQQWSMDEKRRASLCAHDQFAAQQSKRLRLESNQPSHQNSVRSTTYDAMVHSLTHSLTESSNTSCLLFFLFYIIIS